MRKIENLTVGFKKDLSNIEIHGIEKMLENYYLEEFDTEIEAPVLFGLAYTSSSSYATYNVCNQIYIEDYEISHFAITENNMLIAVCTDEEENHHYFEIE